MKITVCGTGYVGLVTGVCLADIGHEVVCFDTDEQKINMLNEGLCPIYEPGLEELLLKQLLANRLHFSTDAKQSYKESEVIFLAVGTPQKEDGAADLTFIEQAVETIAQHINSHTIIVTKSTVPIGTNDRLQAMFDGKGVSVHVVSNPEFLREGSGIYDTFHGDRIVIGSNHKEAKEKVEKIFQPLQIPIVHMSLKSAEMVKYASFLATKISFINEIAKLCEYTGANVEDVALGMGMDSRIGTPFLKAGIGFGGSCFPKDTKALENVASLYGYEFQILQSVIKVNEKQKSLLFDKAMNRMGTVEGKTVAVLGLSFKPNTDDIRDAPSIPLMDDLIEAGAHVRAYDPVAHNHVKRIYQNTIHYSETIENAIDQADLVCIVTEWGEIKDFPLHKYKQMMREPLLIDGRNCYKLEEAKQADITYISIGREVVERKTPIFRY
ncbi:UDP-glucose/GDP-mannose dehydrogenase family protein [Robertmurraya korlensis]|uniref:UDP-glucose dehydrogenase family protein n=1 Tax=Robertmurraya korlensis TaxID=519977 RepID=UPI00203E0CF5|nr:UDP-glucose/GDP-mannose dehydrogenase family protein [Robertmurraya korlensis]MCM3602019.1 UDP-glucose/GDP-mannose dehydrogenase family protein [Robertmurraya korlensis]